MLLKSLDLLFEASIFVDEFLLVGSVLLSVLVNGHACLCYVHLQLLSFAF
jgi:hypothetical protein